MNVAANLDFATKTRALLDLHGAFLLSLAKRSIEHTLKTGEVLALDLATVAPELTAMGACFVTLKLNDRLRGCIGSPEAWRALAIDVVINAQRAAFHDPRFAPLKATERKGLEVHISVLSPAEPFDFHDEADLLAKLVPGTDGLIIADTVHGQARRALFLPSVWTQLPTPEQFLAHLKAKAGLPPDHWSASFQAWRFIAAETGALWDDIEDTNVQGG